MIGLGQCLSDEIRGIDDVVVERLRGNTLISVKTEQQPWELCEGASTNSEAGHQDAEDGSIALLS